MCYNGTFRFKKLDDSFGNGETFRFADYIQRSRSVQTGKKRAKHAIFSRKVCGK